MIKICKIEIYLKKKKKNMKNYFKSITKSFYEKVQRVVEDEYIEPITESEIYAIINRKRRNSVHGIKNINSILRRQSQETQEILDNISRLSLITPEREFMLIGQTYSIDVINYRLKQLKTKIEGVKDHMLSNYPNNLESIEAALLHLQQIKNLSQNKQKANLLRQKLTQLQQVVTQTKRITQLNIRLKNIKQILKIAERIPNVKKMSLFELKNINLERVNEFKKSIKNLYPNSMDNELHCIHHLQYFIDKVSSQHLRVTINEITGCLTTSFESPKYEKALKDFIISKSPIQYQKLLVRLVETEVRDKIEEQINKKSPNNPLLFRCQQYVLILINLFKLFRWHRYNLAVLDVSPQIENKIRARNNSVGSNCSQKSEDKCPAINLDAETSIKINTEQVKSHTCQLIDQCLKQQIQEILFSDIKNERIFQNLALVNNFYQIAFSFSSHVFTESRNLIKEILLRKCYKLHEKGVQQLFQALANEQQSEWYRLPVYKNYRYKSLERTIQKIRRIHLYEKLPQFKCDNFKFLNLDFNSQNQQSIQLEVAQRKSEQFELEQIYIPYEKFEKMQTFEVSESPLPEHVDPQVVISKSSLTILHYFENFLSMYFFIPIQQIRNDILDKMQFYLEYYIYYLFNTFLSQFYKRFFFDNDQNLQFKYLNIRVKTIYKEVSQFIKKFDLWHLPFQTENANGYNQAHRRKDSMETAKYKTKGFSFVKNQIPSSKVSQQNSMKARAIATESIKYILAYFTHILKHLQEYTTTNNAQKQEINRIYQHLGRIQSYKKLCIELSDLLLTDIVPITIKIDFVLPMMKRIKWHEIQSSKEIRQYGSMVLKNIKQIYEKTKSGSKGQIPFYMVDKIFSFYWKTQLTLITKIYLEDHIIQKQKGGRSSKLAFEKFVDVLYEGVMQIVNQKNRSASSSEKNIATEYISQRQQMFKSVYIKIKSIFPILLQSDWNKCKQIFLNTLRNLEFIYKIEISIMKASESCSGISSVQMEQRQVQIDDFIKEEILK